MLTKKGFFIYIYTYITVPSDEHSGSVVECLIRDRGGGGVRVLILTGVTALWPLARHFIL